MQNVGVLGLTRLPDNILWRFRDFLASKQNIQVDSFFNFDIIELLH